MVARLRDISHAFTAIALLALLVSCATTRIDAQWQNPDFAGGKVQGPVLVVGLTRDESARRLYEDSMSVRLGERGIQATPSYRVVTAPLTDSSSDQVLEAARSAGARYVLSSGLIRREIVERAIADPPGWHWDPWYSGWYRTYWPYAHAREVQVFERYVASTSLAEAESGKVVWSARTSTEDTGNLEQEVKAFARAIVRAMADKGLV